jgi:hypothetical protein
VLVIVALQYVTDDRGDVKGGIGCSEFYWDFGENLASLRLAGRAKAPVPTRPLEDHCGNLSSYLWRGRRVAESKRRIARETKG